MRTPEGAEATQRQIHITQPFLPGITVGGVGGRLSTGHLSFVRSMRQRLPRSTPGQQPGTFGRGPPPQSGHRRPRVYTEDEIERVAKELDEALPSEK